MTNQSCRSTSFFCFPHDLWRPALFHEISLASKKQAWEGLLNRKGTSSKCGAVPKKKRWAAGCIQVYADLTLLGIPKSCSFCLHHKPCLVKTGSIDLIPTFPNYDILGFSPINEKDHEHALATMFISVTYCRRVCGAHNKSVPQILSKPETCRHPGGRLGPGKELLIW